MCGTGCSPDYINRYMGTTTKVRSSSKCSDKTPNVITPAGSVINRLPSSACTFECNDDNGKIHKTARPLVCYCENGLNNDRVCDWKLKMKGVIHELHATRIASKKLNYYSINDSMS